MFIKFKVNLSIMVGGQHKVDIYTTSTCHYCHAVKEFFNKYKIQYTEKDVTKDKKALKEMVEKSGSTGVPVIVVDGKWNEVIIGFDQIRLRKSLNITS